MRVIGLAVVVGLLLAGAGCSVQSSDKKGKIYVAVTGLIGNPTGYQLMLVGGVPDRKIGAIFDDNAKVEIYVKKLTGNKDYELKETRTPEIKTNDIFTDRTKRSGGYPEAAEVKIVVTVKKYADLKATEKQTEEAAVLEFVVGAKKGGPPSAPSFVAGGEVDNGPQYITALPRD